MKNAMRNYAFKNRKIKESYLRKHCDGGSGRKAREASCCDSLQQSWKEQKEVTIQSYVKVVLLTKDIIYTGDDNESLRKEDVGQTHQEGRQGIQESDQRRCETEETNTCKTQGEKVKKQAAKEKKHEARETKAYEKKEDKKESKKRGK